MTVGELQFLLVVLLILNAGGWGFVLGLKFGTGKRR